MVIWVVIWAGLMMELVVLPGGHYEDDSMACKTYA